LNEKQFDMSKVPFVAMEELRLEFYLCEKIQPIEKNKEGVFKTTDKVENFQAIDFLWELALTAESSAVREDASDFIAVLYTSQKDPENAKADINSFVD
jgi:hypothetical protein